MIEADFSDIDRLPSDEPTRRRLQMTLQCPDAALLPRVAGAGSVVDGRSGRYQLMHNGLKVVEHGYIGVWVTELIRLMQGLHEPQEEWAFSQILGYIPDNATMIELGSWWAYYSMWFHKQIKNAHNYMIEPDPNNLEVGARNFALNRMTGYHINAAIGRESKDSVLFRCIESDDIERPIRVVSVDDFIAAEQIPSVDLLLADIQGVELDMLEGARQSIAQGRIRFVVISTHHHTISGDPLMHQKCLAFLQEQGAHVLAEHSIPESYSGDGLLVASFRAEDRSLPSIPVSKNTARNSLFGELEYDLARALAEVRETQQHWQTALNSKELERQAAERELDRTRAALESKELDRRKLDKELKSRVKDLRWFANALELKEAEVAALASEKTRLETMIQGIDSVIQDMEAERAAIEQERNALSQPLEDLRQRLLDAEAASAARLQDLRQRLLQSEIDASGRLHALNEIYASVSWRVTAPLRALHIRELARKGLRRVVGVLRTTPLGNAALTALRSRLPRLWWDVARSSRGQSETIASLTFTDLLVPPQIALHPDREDEKRLDDLFRRELARRTANRPEAQS